MATNPYTAPSISGYNTSPPPDAGEQTAANEITWAKHKTKLADPIKTLSETDVTNTTTAFSKVINTDANENNAMAGSLAFTESELTLSSDAVTVTRTAHSIDTQNDDATDDLATLTASSISTGAWLLIRANNTARTIVVKHSTGNILLADDADFSLDDDQKFLLLQYNGTNWQEISRSAPVAFATQTQMEAASATDVVINPALMEHHPSAAKAWGKISGDGTGVDGTAYNLGTIDDDATGLVGINFIVAMSSANYSAGVVAFTSTNGATCSLGAQVAGSFDARCEDAGAGTGADIDPTDSYQVWAFGDQ